MNKADSSRFTEQRKSVFLYGIFIVATVLSPIPPVELGLFAMLLYLCALLAAYYARIDTGEYSLLRNHATYMIRTFWLGNALMILTTIATGLYLFMELANNQLNIEPLEPCLNNDMDVCMKPFMEANQTILIVSALIVMMPVLLYLLFRFIKGLRKALKGDLLVNEKSWF